MTSLDSRPRTMSDASLSSRHSMSTHQDIKTLHLHRTTTKAQMTSPRRSPPTNQNDEYICDFSSECAHLRFHRKCEWR